MARVLTLPATRSVVVVAALVTATLSLAGIARLAHRDAALAQKRSPSPEADVAGVEITPALFERDLPGRDFAVEILIVNHERSARRVELSVSGLGHDLDGAPQFLEPAVATRLITLSTDGFVLDPGERASVVASGSIPEHERSLYAAVIAEFEPLTQVERQIETRSRVASLLLMRGPKPWMESVEVVDVGILPGPAKGPFEVYAAARNTGNVHVRPTGFVRIEQLGQVLDTVELSGERIIPGFARRLVGRWDPDEELDEPVILEAVLRDPPASGTGVVDFRAGIAKRPGAEIVDLAAVDRGGPSIKLAVRNTGSIPIEPAVLLTAVEAGIERARKVIVQDRVAPGEGQEAVWEPSLPDGTYLIKAAVSFQGRLLDEGATALELGSERSPLLWVATALLAVAATLLLLLLVVLRSGRRRAG